MITTRDLKIIDFVKEYKVASTSTIHEVFFSCKVCCYKRLQVLCENKMLTRYRNNVSSEYIYVKKTPKQLTHSLLVTDFYRELHKISTEIVNFKIEPVMGDIRPDAVFGYKKDGKSYLGLLEVEISHKGFNYGKYDKFYSSGDYKTYLPVMPTIFIVGDNIKDIENKSCRSNIKYVVVDTKFENFRL